MVDTDVFKRRVERRISATAGGDVRYESIALGLLPQPRARIRGFKVSVLDIADGKIAAMGVTQRTFRSGLDQPPM